MLSLPTGDRRQIKATMNNAASPAVPAPLHPMRGIGGLAGFALYILGLFGTCSIVWWGAVSLGWWWTGPNRIGLQGPWITALPYISAWAVLTFVSPRKAAMAVLTFPIMLCLTWFLGLVVGIITVFLLGVPGYVCAAAATGFVLMTAQRCDSPIRVRDWAPIHVMGFSLVGLAAAYVVFANPSNGPTPSAPEKFWAAQGPVVIALALHAAWSWIGLIRDGRSRVSSLRVVVLLGAAYLGVGAAFVADAPGRSLLAWPAAPGHDPIMRARNLEWFTPGERIVTLGPQGAETFRVPEGWRARRHPGPGNAARALRLEPLAGTAAGTGPIDIVLTATPGHDWLPGAEDDLSLTHPRFVRCTAQPPAPAGLVLCRRETLIPTLPEDFLAWDQLELAFVLGPGVYGFLPGRYLVFGPGLRGACSRGARCILIFPLTGGGSASFDVAEVELWDIERVRAKSEALLRSSGAAAVAPTRETWPGLR